MHSLREKTTRGDPGGGSLLGAVLSGAAPQVCGKASIRRHDGDSGRRESPWLSVLDDAIIGCIGKAPGRLTQDEVYAQCQELADGKPALLRALDRLVALGHVRCVDSDRVAPRLRRYAPGGAAEQPAGFGAADTALIAKVHRFMPPAQLLAILNDRLASDRGGQAAPHTLEQLADEIARIGEETRAPGDWASLRGLLARARREGVLARIGEETIHDFAVCFSINPKQLLTLKEILLAPAEED